MKSSKFLSDSKLDHSPSFWPRSNYSRVINEARHFVDQKRQDDQKEADREETWKTSWKSRSGDFGVLPDSKGPGVIPTALNRPEGCLAGLSMVTISISAVRRVKWPDRGKETLAGYTGIVLSQRLPPWYKDR